MSFQAYIDNIRAKTGKGPDDFKQLAEEKGLLKPGTKAVLLSPEGGVRPGARSFDGYL